MKFGQEYAATMATDEFPRQWLDSAIEYKGLKKCIKKVQLELADIGLDAQTVDKLAHTIAEEQTAHANADKQYFSGTKPDLSTISEEFSPQLRVLVDRRTGTPLDATLAPETKANLEKLARHEMLIAGRHAELGHALHHVGALQALRRDSVESLDRPSLDERRGSQETKWIQIPLISARSFFDMLEPKLQELEALNDAEEKKLEEEILDLGEMVENVTEPVREGYEAKRTVSYRDLYFWREMFRLYMETPIFYSNTERNHGALTYIEARKRLEAYDAQLRSTGLLAKMKTPLAKAAAQKFLDLNLDILKIMHFQEMNARAMAKILKKFDKQTHLEGHIFLNESGKRHPGLLTNGVSGKKNAGGFANSIARDMSTSTLR